MPSPPPPNASAQPEFTRRAQDQDAQREAHRLEMREARRAGLHWRRLSRWLGLLFFVFGSVLLIYVFLQALGGYQRLSELGALNRDFNQLAGQSKETSTVVQAAVSVFGGEFFKVFYLLILGFIASAIAARGIQFFAASEAVIDEAVVPED